MIVTVKAFATLRMLMPDETRLELKEEPIIADLLYELKTCYPGVSSELFTDGGNLNPLVNILKNGRNIQHLDGLRTLLDYGDIIAVFPSAAGG